MLCLTRKNGERIMVGDGIVITVIESMNGRVRIGVEAPQGVRIDREEVFKAKKEQASANGQQGGYSNPTSDSRL
jgi:carbon storage regulator